MFKDDRKGFVLDLYILKQGQSVPLGQQYIKTKCVYVTMCIIFLFLHSNHVYGTCELLLPDLYLSWNDLEKYWPSLLSLTFSLIITLGPVK